MSTSHTEQSIDIFNQLLRGEISAIETYNQAIEKFRGQPETSVLEEIRSEHISSANELRRRVRSMGGDPSTDSGAWGAFAKTVEGSATLLGENSTLAGLLQGEEHGRNNYEEALGSDDVDNALKDLIRRELLPRQRSHVSTLRGLRHAQ